MSQITVQEMFDFCLENENVFLAHLIYWSVQTNRVSLRDDSDCLKEIPVDMNTVKEYTDQNLLGMKLTKLYVVRDAKEYYAFYFARNGLEASSLHNQLFGTVQSIIEAPSLMHRLMYVEYIDQHVFLIDFRKRFVQFPVYIGHARANEHIIQRMDGQVSKVV